MRILLLSLALVLSVASACKDERVDDNMAERCAILWVEATAGADNVPQMSSRYILGCCTFVKNESSYSLQDKGKQLCVEKLLAAGAK